MWHCKNGIIMLHADHEELVIGLGIDYKSTTLILMLAAVTLGQNPDMTS